MCGLIHIKRFDGKSAVKMIERRYRDQKTRGKDGFGFVASKEGTMVKYLRSADEEQIFDALKGVVADEVLFHHRNPSDTVNIWEQAHPIKVSIGSKYDYYVAHNGLINNAAEIKTDHDKERIPYSTLLREYWLTESGNVINGLMKFNDSETFAIELAKSLEAVIPTDIDKPKGSIAFICKKVDRETGKDVKLYWGRNFLNPLKCLKTDDFLVISSAGGGVEVEPHRLYFYDYETKKYDDQKLQVGIGARAYNDTSGYRQSDYLKDEEEDGFPRGFLGFATKQVPLIEGKKGGMSEYDLEKWMDDTAELESIEKSLEKATDPITIEYLKKEKEEVEASIEAFDKKYPTLAASSVDN